MRAIIIILLFISCENASKKSEIPSIKKIDSIHFQSPKNNRKNSTIEEKKYSDTIFGNLFNKELIGISIKKGEKNKRKYWIDFYSICMCDSPSIFIDKENNKVYLYSYCRDYLPPNKKEFFFEYFINKMILKKNKTEISIKNNELGNLIFKFIELENDVYELKVEGDLPTNYIGSRINAYFTTKPSKFEKEDCGGFDG